MSEILYNALLRQKKEKQYILGRNTIPRSKSLLRLKGYLSSPLIKVILGPRRAGKSTLAFQSLQDQKFAYINFEDETLLNSLQNSDEFVEILEKIEPEADFYLFDEIQNLPDWEVFLNRQHRRGKNIIVTGSNSKLLGKELSTALTGRHITLELLTFSFEEFIAKYDEIKFEEKDYISLFKE